MTWMLQRTGRDESTARVIARKSGGYPDDISGRTSQVSRQNAATDQ